MKLGGGLLFHRFPNPNITAQIECFCTWVMKIGGDNIGEDNGLIYKNRKVCHKHFEDVYKFPNIKLTGLAIPTLEFPGMHVVERILNCHLHQFKWRHLPLPDPVSWTPNYLRGQVCVLVSAVILKYHLRQFKWRQPCLPPVLMDTDLFSRPGELSADAIVTAEVINTEDKLFASVSSDCSDLRRGKLYATN